jgi:hydroxymethylpyrimidine/phosphomethylpyrimidine kinase
VALTIAGSDSGGGAGLQADLKTFAALGVHGTTAITAVTAQNPEGVRAIQACRPEIVQQQIQAVEEAFPLAAVKTGMLFSAGIIEVVAEAFAGRSRTPLIVDPVMAATSGARLLKPRAIRTVRERLLPLARLVTPNLDEAEILSGAELRSVEDLRSAARRIHADYGCAVLVKGGHLSDSRVAADIFFDGKEELLLEAPFVRRVSSHGTGCAYAAAIAGYVALGCPLAYAVEMAKEYITQAIGQSRRIRGRRVLQHFWT